MLIEHLELFIAVAKERHFGRAAETCNVTQPTLSASIKHLEFILGVMLVERDSRFRGLTPEGEQVLVWARRIVADTRAMQDEIRTARVGLSGRIRLAVIPTALDLAAKITTPLIEKYPDVTFSVQSSRSEEISLLLANFEIEAGITYLDTEPLSNIVSVSLCTERYYFVTSDESVPKNLKAANWASAVRFPLCLLSPDIHIRETIDRHMAVANARPVLEANSIQVLFSHVRNGSLSSIMPLNLAETVLTAPGDSHR